MTLSLFTSLHLVVTRWYFVPEVWGSKDMLAARDYMNIFTRHDVIITLSNANI